MYAATDDESVKNTRNKRYSFRNSLFTPRERTNERTGRVQKRGIVFELK